MLTVDFKEKTMAKTEIDRTKVTEVIRVKGDVYDQIADMAAKEERSLGGQVAILTKNACAHPLENREKRIMVVSPVLDWNEHKAAPLGDGQVVRGFFCTKCGTLVANQTNSADVMTATLHPVKA